MTKKFLITKFDCIRKNLVKMHLFSKLLHIVDSGCKEFTRIGQNPVHHGGNHSPSYARNFHTRLLTNSNFDLLTYEDWFVLLFLLLRNLLTYIANYTNTKYILISFNYLSFQGLFSSEPIFTSRQINTYQPTDKIFF